MKLVKNITSLVTVNANGADCKTGKDMSDIGEIKNGAMIFDDKVQWVGTTEELKLILAENKYDIDETLDASGKTIIPGFVDSHTHYVFGGNRSSEFARRLRGVTYQEIAAEGGGIQTTMKATRASSINDLANMGKKLANSAIKYGTTAVEIKSGYGLTVESEINQLKAIKQLQKELPLHISSTFLGAHDFPPEYKTNHDKYIDILINEMLPRVKEENLAEYCDAFIDVGYYSLKEGERVLQGGLDAGMKLKVHCDELADTKSAELAANMGAVSADHLLFVNDNSIEAMKKSNTVATLLPGTAYFIRMPYAPARKIIDSGAICALATDTNPGSCFTENMQMILSLSVINMGMTAEEAITAATLNGARAINQSHRMGSLEIGKDANFAIYDCDSYTDIFYHFGINQISSTWINGEKY
ncbi:MAG: imidazolonepropionase [Bacteroidetes bacterium 4572_77]|nr:MAG: imidazolonepropionase [Bacteroidetes bacterium 4572_77]